MSRVEARSFHSPPRHSLSVIHSKDAQNSRLTTTYDRKKDSMITKPWRGSLAALALAATATLPNSASAQIPSSMTSTCVGGVIGCEQMDFFLVFTRDVTTPAPWLNFFTITLNRPGWLFSDPNIGEAEDGIGFSFFNPVISNGGLTLSGFFDPGFEVLADPQIRVRTQLSAFEPTNSELGFSYVVGLDRQVIGTGEFVPIPPPSPTVTPEPATMILLGSGLAGIAAVRRRRSRNSSPEPRTANG
jgi:hypothetical protein